MIPKIVKAQHIEAFKILITYDNGATKRIDLCHFLDENPQLEEYKHLVMFKTFGLDKNGVLTWGQWDLNPVNIWAGKYDDRKEPVCHA